MVAAESLEPKVLRPLSSPNSPDDLWPEPVLLCKVHFLEACNGALGPAPFLPASLLLAGMAGTEQAARVLRHPPLLP